MTLEELSKSIKNSRKTKKWTQAQMAEYSGIALSTVKKMEAGFVHEVGIQKVNAILDILELEFSLRAKGRPLNLDELNG